MSKVNTPNEGTDHAEPTPSPAIVLSEEDQNWLASHIWRAAEKAFPTGERIGKTRQQDFYFRELLEILIENTLRSGSPITGGTYAEVWEFTRARIAKWRSEPAAVRGRSGYGRQSIKILVHEWRAAFSRRSRAAASRKDGLVEFFLESPNPESDDLVLRASVANFTLSSGASFDFQEDELSPVTRLPSKTSGTGDDEEEKARLLREARKFVRKVETEYLDKLSKGPTEFIEEEVRELRRYRNNRRKIAAAVLGFITAGMIGYRILYTERITPFVEISPDKKGGLMNVDVDAAGHIALTSQGKRTSDWVDVIIDEGGRSMRVGRQIPGGAEVIVKTDELGINFDIPQRWREKPEIILHKEGTCTSLNAERGVLCAFLLDIRNYFPSATIKQTTFVVNWGDGHGVQKMRGWPVSDNAPRVMVSPTHRYASDGTYDIWLIVSPRAQDESTPSFDDKGAVISPLVRLTLEAGRLKVARNDSEPPDWMLPPAEVAERLAARQHAAKPVQTPTR